MEAILLAGGQAKRLGDAAEGLPKALVPVAGAPLVSYTSRLLARAGVERLIVSCAAGQGWLFERALGSIGPELVLAEEPERLGRGGGLRFAAAFRSETGPLFALNADELLAPDFGALMADHRKHGAAATIVVTPLTSPFGIADVDEDWTVNGFLEAPQLPHWVNVGVYVLDDEAIARLPERGDHERSTFPELAAEGRLRAWPYDGEWLTVNTPKDLERAGEHLRSSPDFFAPS
ncbi:MAG TPA: nucleotidyltransferase family protein [Gaiellaceae bacterium]|nr:nucleotidyltransferase family protein [Gaiellaceae bacterium]